MGDTDGFNSRVLQNFTAWNTVKLVVDEDELLLTE